MPAPLGALFDGAYLVWLRRFLGRAVDASPLSARVRWGIGVGSEAA